MLTSSVPWSINLIYILADAAIRALVLAVAAGFGLALFRVKASRARLFTWNTVLYAALAMPLLSWLLPVLPIPMPSIFRHGVETAVPLKHWVAPSSQANSKKPSSPAMGRNLTDAKMNFAASAGTHPPELRRKDNLWLSANWEIVVAASYLVIAGLLLGRLALGVLLSRRLVLRGREVHDFRLVRSLAPQTQVRALRILESEHVAVPVTVGTLRPAILLPANWREWDEAKLSAVLAHELSHVARHDALTQFLARFYRAAFWFNPLSWWLARQIHLLAEQASDEAALSAGVDRSEYAKTLLGFFETLQATPRVWWQGVAMAKAGQAEHRVERILSWRGVVNMGTTRSVLVVIAAFAVPAIYLVAAARPANHNVVVAQTSDNAQSGVLPGAPSAPTTIPVAPAIAPVAPVHGAASGVAAPALPAAPSAPGVPAAPAIWSGQSHSYGTGNGHGFAYAYGFDEDQRFVIVSGKSDSFTMSGTGEDARHVQRLKKQIPGDFIWFQRDEKSYIIRDQATVDRARKLWAPQEELGKKQEELGKQQEALGKQQEELSAKMERVKVNVPDMTAQLDALKAKLQKLGPTATMEQIGDLQSEIGELQSKLGELQSHAGDEQGKFGSQMGELGEQQGKLGEEQGRLGEQQAELAEKATKQMKELLDEAIRNGTAQPEPENGGGASL